MMSSEETKSVERVFDEKDRGCSPLLKDIRLGCSDRQRDV